ncbi:MAG TPA: HAD-IIB family hydrolase [Ottowia sp.]|uniref:HAD family hydrolase n=1 Tax=Ottowia sp. TaxID=1898956 RepID=UPI002B7C7A27|nr:HAD-IIB family hydrolase [Ottowia sp.]HMN20047.1 HAD-IIB family hydrolase [Ottowia sp.]
MTLPPSAPSPPQPLSSLPADAWRAMLGVFTDIDDTLTAEGAITPEALDALARLRGAGLHCIAITGRPVGWSVPFAQTWPLDAIVAENGAVALFRDDAAAVRATPGAPGRLYQADAATRAANHARLQAVAARVLREVPGATLARDSAGRETDIAIDHSEFSHLDAARIAQVATIMRSEGLQATVSSIHVNGWIGPHDKWQGACWIARALLGRDLPDEVGRWVYVGDSTNDQVMFRHFPHSVGVANIRRFAHELTDPPRYVTEGERGAGFAEVVERLLADRAAGETSLTRVA